MYGIPPGISSMAAAPAGAAQGVNGFGRRGYGGPCPPRGAAHHYHLVVLALDTRLGLAAGDKYVGVLPLAFAAPPAPNGLMHVSCKSPAINARQ